MLPFLNRSRETTAGKLILPPAHINRGSHLSIVCINGITNNIINHFLMFSEENLPLLRRIDPGLFASNGLFGSSVLGSLFTLKINKKKSLLIIIQYNIN